MTTTLVSVVGATTLTTRLLGCTIEPRALSSGHTTFVMFVENTGGTYNGVFDADDDVTITVNGVNVLKGYLDAPAQIYSGRFGVPVGGQVYPHILRLSGRDCSQDLSNLRLTYSYPAATLSDDLLDDALSRAGAEITYTSGSAYDAVGGLEPRDEYLLTVFQEVLERADLDGYVDMSTPPALILFPIASAPSSGIVISDSHILKDVKLSEADGLDLRNTFTLYGAATVMRPTDEDYTETDTEDDANVYTEDALAYDTVWTFVANPAADEYANCWFINFDYDLAGTDIDSAWVKVTYEVTGSAKTDVPGSEVNYVVGSSAAILLWADVSADANWGEDVTVTIRIEGFIVPGVGAMGDEFMSVTNISLGYSYSEAGWTNENRGGGFVGDAEATLAVKSDVYIRGSYSMFSSVAAGQSITLADIQLGAPVDCKYQEHNYRRLKFSSYVDCDKDINCMAIILISEYTGTVPTGYFYKLLPMTNQSWQQIDVPLGVNQNWSEQGSPDWTNIIGINIQGLAYSAIAVWSKGYIDWLHFAEKPEEYSTTDAGSIAAYKTRQYVEYYPNSTLAEITAQALNLKAKLKDPLEVLDILVQGDVGFVGGVWKWLPANKFQIDSTPLSINSGASDNYRFTGLELICFPRTNVEGTGHDFVARIKAVPIATLLQAKRLREISGY